MIAYRNQVLEHGATRIVRVAWTYAVVVNDLRDNGDLALLGAGLEEDDCAQK